VARSLNVVIVASELPYPPTAGGRIRTLNLTLRLARRHCITFIAHRNDESDEAVRLLRGHGIETLLVDRSIPPKSGLGFYIRLSANLASPLPYSVASHDSRLLRREIADRAQRPGVVDLWQMESTVLFDMLAQVDDAPKIVMAPNVETLIWQRYWEVEPNPLRGWYIKRQWRKFACFERRAFSSATRVVAVSQNDARLIRDQFGGRSVDVVDNGVDRGYFTTVAGDRDPKQILFLGGFDWRPNLDAVALLLDRIFPAVRKVEPSARLCLVGRRPPAGLLRRVKACDGVSLHADVPDVRPFLARSGVMVVPLRIGGGSRVKILEAMASGLPVISTRVGAEGLEVVPGKHYIAADDSAALALALVSYLQDAQPAQDMARSCRDFVLDRYDWDKLAERLEQIWFDCVENSAVEVVGSHGSQGDVGW
jgi:glycosyltransferase involved in cell wall biosynthesis